MSNTLTIKLTLSLSLFNMSDNTNIGFGQEPCNQNHIQNPEDSA